MPRHTQEEESGLPASEDLRPLTWGDLRARLEAARDLRRAVDSEAEDRLASFDAYSADRIAAHTEGKEAVYPDDLANCKGPGPKNEATSADNGDCGSEPGN